MTRIKLRPLDRLPMLSPTSCFQDPFDSFSMGTGVPELCSEDQAHPWAERSLEARSWCLLAFGEPERIGATCWAPGPPTAKPEGLCVGSEKESPAQAPALVP